MKIFHAIVSADTVNVFYDKTRVKLNILISYAYQDKNISLLTKKYRDKIGLLYLDSGAFSVITGKKRISIREYATFLSKYGDLFDACFNLDDRFDDIEHNLNNQYYLEEVLSHRSWKPVPVVHDAVNPMSEFRIYAENGYKSIALGSMGAEKKIPKKQIEEIVKTYPDIKVHLFGQTNIKLLEKIRPYSADSAGWAHQAGKGGSIYYWRPTENKRYTYSVGGIVGDNKKHIKKSPFWGEIEKFLKSFGYTEKDLQDPTSRQIINLHSMVQFEHYVNSLQK